MLFYIILAVFVGLPVYLFLGKLIRWTIVDWLFRLINRFGNPQIGFTMGYKEVMSIDDDLNHYLVFLFVVLWPLGLVGALLTISFLTVLFIVSWVIRLWIKIIKFCLR